MTIDEWVTKLKNTDTCGICGIKMKTYYEMNIGKIRYKTCEHYKRFNQWQRAYEIPLEGFNHRRLRRLITQKETEWNTAAMLCWERFGSPGERLPIIDMLKFQSRVWEMTPRECYDIEKMLTT